MLTLSTLRCPDSVAPQTRQTGGGEFSIGRGPENSWALPDPDRHLSKRHCVLAFRGGGWQVADLSTNGTFLNRDADPIGPGAVRDLRDGDRLRIGAYEIELRIEEDAAAAPSAFGGGAPAAAAARAGGNPFADDPFDVPGPAPLAPPAQPPGWRDDGALLPPDFDPLAPPRPDPFGDGFRGASLPDHGPAVADAFRAPAAFRDTAPAPGALPDDWDLDEPLVPPPAPAAPPPVRTGWDDAPAQPVPAPPPPSSAAAAPVWEPPPAAPPVAPAWEPPPPVAPAAAPAPAPSGAWTVEPHEVAPAIAPAPPSPTPSPALAPADAGLLAAFLRGAGMPGATPAGDPAAAMESLGAAFRAMVGGLRAVLIARASIKGEFRIEQTMIRARGNNPLKFSADDDDALAALLGAGRSAGMAPAAAVAEALRDVRLHELATMAATQSAVRALLDGLAPAKMEEAAAGGVLPVQRRARAFEAYEAAHAATVAALADDFDSAFGKSFARAYEQALREAEAGDREGR